MHVHALAGLIAGPALVLAVAGCSAGPRAPDEGTASSAIVYGADDREELYEVEDVRARHRIRASVGALVPKAFIVSQTGSTFRTSAPSYGMAAGLCPDERFFDEPAAALCTVVLVDWDLVLTAAHCLHVLPRQELAVVLGYAYDAPGRLAVEEEDVIDVDSVVAEAFDPAGSEPRRDFAWVRLARPVGPSRTPVSLRRAELAAGAPLTFAGASGGVPLKVDQGAWVFDARADHHDFFVANVDSSGGASGGAAFDEDLALAGILARGGPDLVLSVDGCAMAQVESDSAPQEELTAAGAALAGLCDSAAGKGEALCRASCGEPCGALPRPFSVAGGCSVVAGEEPRNATPALLAVGFALSVFARRRRAPAPRPSRPAHSRARK